MEFICSHCEYRSRSRDFFRREKVWYAPWRRTFCHGCRAYVPNALERRSWTVPPAMLLLGAVMTQLGLKGAVPGIGYLFVFLGSMALSASTVIVVHEIGHAVVGWLAGIRVTHMFLGLGPPLLSWRIGRMHVVVRSFALGGGVVGYQSGEPRKWRQAVFVAGGALANAAFFAAVSSGFSEFLGARRSPAPLLLAVLLGLLAAHGIAVFVNLRPRRAKLGQPPPVNDGSILFRLPRERNFRQHALDARLPLEVAPLISMRDYSAVRDRLEPVLGRSHAQPMILFHYIYALAKLTSPRHAIHFYLLSSIDLDEVGREHAGSLAFVYALLAWMAIVARDEDLIGFADVMSRKAIEVCPGPTEIEGTRGMAQILDGDIAEGTQRALLAMRTSENETLRVEIPRALAIAERAKGNAAIADELLRLATHLEARIEARFVAYRRSAVPA